MAANRAKVSGSPTSVARVTATRPDAVARPAPVSSAALLAVVVTVLAWASAFVAIRAVGAHYEPGPLALGRLLVGTLALGVSVLVSRRWVRPNRREWLLIAVAGVAWFAAYNVALNAAEQRVDAGTTAMLVNVGPILIALFAGLLLGEGFPRWLVIGALVAFSGAVLVGWPRRRGTSDLWGACSAWSRPSRTPSGCWRRSPLCAGSRAAGHVPVLRDRRRRLPAVHAGLVREVAAAPVAATGWLVYLGVVPTALAFSTWAYALARMDAGRLGVSTYAVPPITIALGAVLLGEVPPLLAVVGGVICLVGVGLSRRR